MLIFTILNMLIVFVPTFYTTCSCVIVLMYDIYLSDSSLLIYLTTSIPLYTSSIVLTKSCKRELWIKWYAWRKCTTRVRGTMATMPSTFSGRQTDLFPATNIHTGKLLSPTARHSSLPTTAKTNRRDRYWMYACEYRDEGDWVRYT